MKEEYTPTDLEADLWRMVQVGLLEVNMREDGEWVYKVSDKAASMTEEERLTLFGQCNNLEYPFKD